MKSVLITGANRGLGLALADAFHAEHTQLYLVIRRQELEGDLVARFPGARILVHDIILESYEERLREFLRDATIDILINNAGTGSKAPLLQDATAVQLRKEFDTHCVAAFSTVKAGLDALTKSEAGLILNISSRRGSLSLQATGAAKGSGCSYSYRIGKAAQNMLTLCLADELEDMGITVAAVHPGRLVTGMSSSDACMNVEESARRIAKLALDGSILTRDYLCMETGSLTW